MLAATCKAGMLRFWVSQCKADVAVGEQEQEYIRSTDDPAGERFREVVRRSCRSSVTVTRHVVRPLNNMTPSMQVGPDCTVVGRNIHHLFGSRQLGVFQRVHEVHVDERVRYPCGCADAAR